MIRLAPPNFSFADVLKSCQDNDNREHQNKTIIPRVNRKIQELEILYDDYAQQNKLHSCDLSPFFVDEDIVYLEKLYSYRLRSTDEGRVYYNKFLEETSNYCPYCNHGEISQIDHFLPQGLYEGFTVYPRNLIPICAVCNKAKGHYYGTSESSNLIHPYFDNINHSQWLFAHLVVNSTNNFFVKYVCEPNPENFDIIEVDRIKNNFNKLKLNKRFSNIARSQIRDIRFNLTKIISFSNEEAKKAYIRRLINQKINIHGLNHWNVALYQAFNEYNGDLNDLM